MANINISKGTGVTISVALLVSLIGFGYVTGSRVATLESQVNRNTSDIDSVLVRLDTLNQNLVETNGNIIDLKVRLENLAGVKVFGNASSDKSVTILSSPPSVVHINNSVQEAPKKEQKQPWSTKTLQDALCVPVGICL